MTFPSNVHDKNISSLPERQRLRDSRTFLVTGPLIAAFLLFDWGQLLAAEYRSPRPASGTMSSPSKNHGVISQVSGKMPSVTPRNSNDLLEDINLYIGNMKQEIMTEKEANNKILNEIDKFIHDKNNVINHKSKYKLTIIIINQICEPGIYEEKLEPSTFRKIAGLLDRLDALGDDTNAAIAIMKRLVKLDIYSKTCLESLRVY